jgi:hypothetical protein
MTNDQRLRATALAHSSFVIRHSWLRLCRVRIFAVSKGIDRKKHNATQEVNLHFFASKERFLGVF